MRHGLFLNEDRFKQTFAQGLQAILQQPDLGCFILACANAYADPALHRQMLPDIERQLALLQQALMAGALDTGALTATTEDKAVFLKIVERGLDTIPTVQYRQLGHWRCQLNHLRTMRPLRMAGKTEVSLYQDYSTDSFNFNKPFIQKECLWEGPWQGKQLSWYYNKFPFARYHGLLVPERDRQQPQYLTRSAHELIWQLLEGCAEHFHGLGVGYNSLGAFASVNHLHFQWFLEAEGLAVMSPQWRHNGGSVAYPLACYRYADPQQAWQAISAWHQQAIPYNLIYTANSLYAMPRRIQSQITHQDWTSGFSWSEAGGEIVVQNAASFAELSAGDIEEEMGKLNRLVGEA